MANLSLYINEFVSDIYLKNRSSDIYENRTVLFIIIISIYIKGRYFICFVHSHCWRTTRDQMKQWQAIDFHFRIISLNLFSILCVLKLELCSTRKLSSLLCFSVLFAQLELDYLGPTLRASFTSDNNNNSTNSTHMCVDIKSETYKFRESILLWKYIHNPTMYVVLLDRRCRCLRRGITQLTAQHNQTLEILASIISKMSDQEKKFMKVDGGWNDFVLYFCRVRACVLRGGKIAGKMTERAKDEQINTH